MGEFLLSYDLEGDTSLGARRVLYSQWVMSGISSRAVFDAVKDLFTAADRLLVSPYREYTYHNLLG